MENKEIKVRRWLKECRAKNNIAQVKMAKLLKISETYYCEIENGNRKRKMDIELLQKIAKVLKLTIEDAIKYENTYSKQQKTI